MDDPRPEVGDCGVGSGERAASESGGLLSSKVIRERCCWSSFTILHSSSGVKMWTSGQAGAQLFEPALPVLRMNRPAGRFTSSAPTNHCRCRTSPDPLRHGVPCPY